MKKNQLNPKIKSPKGSGGDLGKISSKDPKHQLAQCEQKLAEYQAGWQRAKADYANLQKRTAVNCAETIKYASQSLLLEIIPILDNLRSAYQALPKDLADNDWVKGIGFIKQQLEKLLENNQVEAIKAVGEQFDPHWHEAVEEVASDKDKGIIVEEILRGYQLAGKVIRPARVKVAK